MSLKTRQNQRYQYFIEKGRETKTRDTQKYYFIQRTSVIYQPRTKDRCVGEIQKTNLSNPVNVSYSNNTPLLKTDGKTINKRPQKNVRREGRKKGRT